MAAPDARSFALGALLAAGLLPSTAASQTSSGDSTRIVRDGHEAQADFEEYRESRTLLRETSQPGGACDAFIGRICIWFGGAEEEVIPGELRDVGPRRVDLIRGLFDAY